MRGHALYIAVLVITGTVMVLGAGLFGADYYLTPLKERPFHPKHELLKPTGVLGQGYGVVGGTMIILGVGIYSARKRIRLLSTLGKAKHVLEFHIFLCLTGPLLVIYHTTFKIGGLVAVSFWSMVAVVLSGFVGRYLYVQIPRSIHGNELTLAELSALHASYRDRLEHVYGLDPALVQSIDAAAAPPRMVGRMSALQMLSFVLRSDFRRRRFLKSFEARLRARHLNPAIIGRILAVARSRTVLARRIAILEKVRVLFHHWHVIHMPFSIIMFLILLVHVAVAITFGYKWIF